MKRFCFAFALVLIASSSFSQITGIWQNADRFVEFTADAKMRVVLKPYYGFVYQPTPFLPCTVSSVIDESGVPAPGLFTLVVRYAGEKKDSVVSVARLGDALYFRFYRKLTVPVAVNATIAENPSTAAGRAESVTSVAPGMSSSPSAARAASGPLDGFWLAAGNADALRLYQSEPIADFYCYYFKGTSYYRIRYWAADVRFKDIQAEFTAGTGELLTVPKFIPLDGTLYTCITSNGKALRNYETGTFSLVDGAIIFKPSNIVFAGTAAAKPLRYTLSADGSLLALGAPYLIRSKIMDLGAEIAAHNALRRPPRKPIFGFMDLDFHWDEIEKIRGGKSGKSGN